MSTKPLSPTEVAAHRKILAPDFVIQAWNDCIAEKWDGRQSKVLQEDLVQTVLKYATTLLEREVAFEKGYLDLEPVFRDEGWDVEYRRPAYCESFPAYFLFKPAQKA
jgi:hypothetical protein